MVAFGHNKEFKIIKTLTSYLRSLAHKDCKNQPSYMCIDKTLNNMIIINYKANKIGTNGHRVTLYEGCSSY